MADLNDFIYTDNVHDVLAVYMNRLLASTLRSEYKNVETLVADKELTDGDTPIQNLDGDGASWDVILPPGNAVENHPFLIINGSNGSEVLTVKSNDELTTYKALGAGEFILMSPNGGGRYLMISGISDHGGLTGLADDDHTQYLLATGLREWAEQASDPSTPASGKWKVYFKSGGLYLIDDAGTVTGPLGSSNEINVYPAHVRLSVVSGVDNPLTNQSAKTRVYAMQYKGKTYPLWNGTTFTPSDPGGELYADLNASYHLANNVYDVLYFDDNGTKRIGFGVAWASTTSRGTGAGTAEVEIVNGVKVNKYSMTVRNGSNSYTVAARYGTVIGKIYPSTNGQINWTSSKCELANEYNPMKKTLIATIPTSTWAYTTATWRAAGGNTTVGEGRVVFVCNDACPVTATYGCYGYHSVTTGTMVATGVGIDVTNANSAQQFGTWADNIGGQINCKYSGNLAEGGHFINSLEYSTAAGTMTWTGSSYNPAANPALIVDIEA